MRPRVDVDGVTADIGKCGSFHRRTIIVAVLVGIFDGMNVSEYMFTTARIKSRCYIPECDTNDPEFSPSWIVNAIPGNSGTIQSCYRYANTSTFGNMSCDAQFFSTEVVPCERHVYEHMDTVVYDFNLGCNEWRRSFIGSAVTMGKLVALPVTGYMSDRWGRRVALVFSAFNCAWLGLCKYFARTYVGFVVVQFMESALGFGVYTCAYILLLELPGLKYRVLAGAIINTSGSVGQILIGLIAWNLQNWRHLTLALHVPQLLTFLYFWIVPESIHWYMANDKFEDMEISLTKYARINGKQISEKTLNELKRNAEEISKKVIQEKENKVQEPKLVVQVFQNKHILIRCLVSPVWWITTTFVYYGLTVTSTHISEGSTHLNFIYVSLAGIPGFWIGMILMDIIGRKPTLIGAYWICAVCLAGYIFVPNGRYAASLTLYLIGKLSICTVGTVMYVYTGELYPTKCRHSLFAYSSMVGRVGAILAPLTPAFGTIWEHLNFTLFASLALISGLLVFLTPETLGTKLPDTMEEATEIGKKPSAL